MSFLHVGFNCYLKIVICSDFHISKKRIMLVKKVAATKKSNPIKRSSFFSEIVTFFGNKFQSY